MIHQARIQSSIAIVDPQPADYGDLLASAAADGTDVRFFTNGRQALCCHGHTRADLWLINVELPDISGGDLYRMLRSRLHGIPVYLVGNEYRLADELLVYEARMTKHLVKPLPAALLTDLRLRAPPDRHIARVDGSPPVADS